MTALVVRGGEVDGRPADVVVDGGLVAGLGPDLVPPPGADVLDAAGGAVLPGLHDHHLHLLAMAAARRSLDVGALRGPAAFDTAVREAPGAGPLRVVGHHEHHHGPLDRARLDALAPGRAVRVQHATGAQWVHSSAAGGGGDGVHLGAVPPVPDDGVAGELGAVGRVLVERGVTGVTDATPFADDGGPRLLAAAAADGRLPLHLRVTGGLDLGDAGPPVRGPVKLVIADHEVPDLAVLAAAIRAAHDRGRPVAVHCVTAVALALLLAAWAEVGVRPGDRVEHGAVVDPAGAAALADLGVTVVTQPHFVVERGDRYLAEVEDADRPHLWPCASLLAAGVPVGAGTDAPYGSPDPWAAMAAAVARRTAGGRALGPVEAVAPGRALALFLGPLEAPGGPARRLVPGAAADLCVLDRPLAAALDDLAAVVVRATVVAGRVVHAAP